MGRPKKLQRISESIKVDKRMKAIGAFDAKKSGNKIELLLNPNTMPANVKKTLGDGLMKTGAASQNLYDNPFDAPFFDKANDYLNLNPHEKIRLAMRWFMTDPLVGKVIELMKIFSNDGFRNDCSDPKIKNWYDNWCDMVDIELVLGWLFLEYYRSGNVTTVRELMYYNKDRFNLAAPEYSVGNYISELEFSKATAAKKNMYTKKAIPIGYTVLNPLMVHVTRLNGYTDDLFINTNTIVEPTSTLDSFQLILQQMPPSLQDLSKKTGKIPLQQKNCRRILRMRQPYEPYGQVMMERAFNAIYEKNKMRQLDMGMVNGAINQITKITIGNDQFPATQRQLKNLVDAFQNSGKGQKIFWNHTLKIEIIQPDTDVLNNEKYARVDADIRQAFGISEILTGGGTSKTNFATAYLSLKAFVANLREGRRDILRWLTSEYKDIADAMGFKTYPIPKFDDLSLTDEVAEKQLILQMLDRGVISYESAQATLGYDPQIELTRRKREVPLIQEGILGIAGAQPPEDTGAQAPVNSDVALQQEIKTQDQNKVDTEGDKVNNQNRHADITGNPSKPQGMKKPKPTNGKPAGKTGRPTGAPAVNYKKNRKAKKIKGQASEIEIEIEPELQPE